MKRISIRNHRLLKIITIIVMLTGFLLKGHDAHCVPITYYFGGSISVTRDYDDPRLESLISTGDHFKGTLCYDPEVADEVIAPDGEGNGRLWQRLLWAINITEANVSFSTEDYDMGYGPEGIHAGIEGMYGSNNTPGYFFDTFGLTLVSSSGSLGYFNANGAPSADTMGLIDSGTLYFHEWHFFQAPYDNNPDLYTIYGTLDYFSTNAPVPEPTSLLLISSGLLGLVAFRRKIKS